MSSLAQQRRIVEQLRREADIKRARASNAIEDLKVNNQLLFVYLYSILIKQIL